jgi:hypothetical protein
MSFMQNVFARGIITYRRRPEARETLADLGGWCRVLLHSFQAGFLKEAIMGKLFPITVVAFAAAAFFVTDVKADNSAGVCNSIVASGMRGAQTCENMSCAPGDDACMDVTNVFIEFVTTDGCVDLFANGELKGLPGNASIQPNGPNAGGAKHVQELICGAVRDCGLCPSALLFGICVLPCEE